MFGGRNYRPKTYCVLLRPYSQGGSIYCAVRGRRTHIDSEYIVNNKNGVQHGTRYRGAKISTGTCFLLYFAFRFKRWYMMREIYAMYGCTTLAFSLDPPHLAEFIKRIRSFALLVAWAVVDRRR